MKLAATALLAVWGLSLTPLTHWFAGQPATQTASRCSKIWVGREAEMEEFLRTAQVARIEAVPIGVTKPKRAFFEPGGPIESAAWKPLRPGMHRGYAESYAAEIAAYEIDKLLELHMVPPYVERRISGDRGALSLWVENVSPWKVDQPTVGPDVTAWNREVTRMKMFDQLIGNIDRNQGNLLYDAEYHLILIDHSRALTTARDLSKMAKLSLIDRELWEKMLALGEEDLRKTLSAWLKDPEIKAILARRDLMKAAIDKLVAARGDSAFVR